MWSKQAFSALCHYQKTSYRCSKSQIIMRKTFILCTALLTLSLFAQQPLDSVKVSATRLPVKLHESGKNITILSQRDIQQLPVTTVDELLQYVGGINLNSRGGFGVQSDIGMRGSTFSQVLVLVDNQRINDPLTAHFNSNIPIPLSEIHHIEVVRGSAAASYGADAVGGIIHVKTKTYAALFEEMDYSDISGNIAYGDHNLTLTDVGVHQQRKKFGFSAAMKSARSTGEEYVNPNYTQFGLGDSLYNNYFDLKTYTGALAYRGERLKLYGRAGFDARDFGTKYFYTANRFDESSELINSYWTQASAIYDNEVSTTELSASYRNTTDSFTFNPLFSNNFHTTQRLNATLSQKRKVNGINLSYGVQTDWQDIISTDRGDHNLISNGVFLLAHKRINNWSLNGGLRGEFSEKIGAQFVPQLNVAYRMKNYVLRSSMGRSIRQADFTEQYNFYLRENTPALFSIGNPDLAAESAYTFDVGIDAFVSKKLQFTNTVFARQSSNLIDYTLTNSLDINNLINLRDSTDYFYAQNIKESFTWGNEFGVKYTHKYLQGLVNANVNYTYINTTTPDSVVSKYIANHPVHNINGSVNATFSGFGLNIGGAYITRNADAIADINGEIKPNYALLNAKFSYTAEGFPVSVYLDVRNILNTQYQEILGANMPQRWILGGIRWNIKRIKVDMPRP
jgi:iron complex outermembrane receptor protein